MKKQVQFKVLLDILVSVNDDLKIARDNNNSTKIKQYLEDIQGLSSSLIRLVNEENADGFINKEEIL